MNNKELNQKHYDLIESLLTEANELLTVKAKEYVRNDDPFHNFKAGAKFTGWHPLEVLQGFKLKHDVSLSDLFGDYVDGETVSAAQLKEKTIDSIVYTLLAYSLIINEVK